MRVLLFMDWSLAMQFLEPIYTYIKANTDWEAFFVATDPLSVSEVEKRGYPLSRPTSDYDFAICCDGWSACPTRNRINTFHGLAAKGHELSSNRAGRYGGNHVAISPYIKDILINRMGVPGENIIDGGLTKFDTITEIPALRKEPRILYAPTFNEELSSLPMLGSSILDLPNVAVKLHSYTNRDGPREFHGTFRSYVQDGQDPNYSEDITQQYLDHDIVIADGGSTVVEPLALGRMVIRVQNPRFMEHYRSAGVSDEEVQTYPEIYYPNKYAFEAQNIEEIQQIIANEYASYTPPTEEIISNIGHYQVSKAICDFIEQS